MNEYRLNPPTEHCQLCDNEEMTCECGSIEGVTCQYCESILYTPGEKPSWGECDCGRTLHEFIKEAPRPGRGYVSRYPQ
jgi:hypothetical protein